MNKLIIYLRFPLYIKQFFYLFTIFLLAGICFAQSHTPPNIQWEHSYGGSKDELGIAIIGTYTYANGNGYKTNAVQTYDGGYIIAGISQSNDQQVTGNHGLDDYWIIKTDRLGGIQWEKSLGGSFEDDASAIQQTRDSGYIVIGGADSKDGDVTGHHYSITSLDSWVVKLDKTGNIQWERSIGGISQDWGEDVQQTSDGGYITLTVTTSPDGDAIGNSYGESSALFMKFDSSGNTQWTKLLLGDFPGCKQTGVGLGFEASSIRQTVDKGYIVAGTLNNMKGSISAFDRFSGGIVKLDSAGNVKWLKILNDSGDIVLTYIRPTREGGYIAAGYINSNGGDVIGYHGRNGSFEYWVIKLNGFGGIEWQKCLGGDYTPGDYAADAEQTTDGGYIAGGFSDSPDSDVTGNHGANDYWVVQLDTNGALQWEKSLGGTNYEYGGTIHQTNDGGYIVSGISNSNDGDVTENHGGFDIWVVKLLGKDPLISADTLNCGALICGDVKDTVLYVRNIGTDTLRIGSIQITGADSNAFQVLTPFSVSIPNPDTSTKAKSDSIAIAIRFVPQHGGISNGVLEIYSNDSTQLPYAVAITGTKDSTGFTLSDTSIDFGKIATCANDTAIAITVTNTGNVPLTGAMQLNANVSAFFRTGTPLFPIDTGKSTSMTVHFTHLKDSIYTGSITLYTQCDSVTIPIHGEGVTPQLSVTSADLGATCSGSTDTGYVTLVNMGDTSATITSLTVAAPFKVDSPAVPFTVPAHDSIRVRGIFSPTSDGQFSQALIFRGQPCNVSAMATLTGQSGTPSLAASGADFGNVCLGDTARQTIMLRNTGSVAATVNSINVSNAFVVLTQLPLVISAGDSQAVSIGFVPTSAVPYSSNVIVQGSPCNISAESQVQGLGVSVALSSLGVDFGTTQVNTQKDSTVTITNSGASSVTVQLQTSLPFSIDMTSVTIPANGSITIGVHYMPTQTGKDTSALSITASVPCMASLTILLTGADTTITTATQSAVICSPSPAPVLPAVLIDLPVSLSDNIIAPVDSVAFDVAYNRVALFYLTATSPRCGLRVERVNSGDLHITAFSCGTPLSAGDIADVKFVGLVTSSDTTYTQVNINNVTFYPAGTVTGSGCSVPVTINPYCGLHGVYYIGATSLAQNYPNPFTGTTTIHVTLSQSDAEGAQLKIYNMLGEEVADLTSQLAPNADISFNAEENKAGVYYYTLQTPSGRLTRQMFVVR